MDHIYVFITLIVVLGLFVWGKIRHDFVALIALFVLVVLGLIPPEKAFLGFGHPAVITVAAVLIIGSALEHSGLIDILGKWVSKLGNNHTLQILTLSLVVGVASAFMNNVGALAILMPVAINLAKKSGYSPSHLLMPIAFASLLGGMTTLIGTPPNIIIASFRAQEMGEPFGMFDFVPVGFGVMLVGILFIALVGWRLIPKRKSQKSELESFRIEDYITEVLVTPNSKVINKPLAELAKLSKADFQILGLVRQNKRIHAPDENEVLLDGDIIIIESDTQALKGFIYDTDLKLVGDKKFRIDAVGSKNIAIREAVVLADSPLVGRTTAGMKMRSRFGVNLLAVSRREEKIHHRLDRVVFLNGDVLMLQGREHMIAETIVTMGCLPLARKGLRIGYERKIALSLGIFVVSVLLIIAGLLPVHIAFPMAAAGMVLSGVLPVKKMYTSIDWPVIVLLGAMLPVGTALETSGGASIIAQQILGISGVIPIWATLSILLVSTMLLSNVINNAATVVLMAPIGIGIAKGMEYSVDPFLMIIAIGASAAFLTPIGHQSNTLVMGPGGYKFSDFLYMGIPISIITAAIAIPLIIIFWPL
ncbi:MAG: SLC13 family permease [Tenuifilaceae bacterium]|jgi:di/tricarboxylate transporter|nr:SLC13 family permease [Tenuifilaceae bacterium]